MYEQRGCFAGLDTCNHVEFGRFDRYSILRHEIEDKAISNRFDVKLHLNSLCNNNIISTEMAETMTESANYFNSTNDLRKYYYGATYIPLEAAIAYQQDIIDRNITIIIPNRNEYEDGIKIKIGRYWPKFLYPCHQTSFHGCQMILVPYFFGGVQNKQLWEIVALISQTEELWQLCIKNVTHSTSWIGWILTFITNKCLHAKYRQHPKDPFKLTQIANNDAIRKKLPRNRSNIQLLRTIQHGNHCVELDDFSYEEIKAIEDDSSNFEYKVLMLASSGPIHTDYIGALEYMKELKNGDKIMELRSILISSTDDSSDAWKGEIYSRHGNGFSRYWYQKRGSKTPLKKQPKLKLLSNHEYIFTYCLKRETDMKGIRNSYIELLGGQFHAQCNIHKKPLVSCYEKNKKCRCGKKALYACKSFDCHSCVCKNCFNGLDKGSIHLIDPVPQNEANETSQDDDNNAVDSNTANDEESNDLNGSSNIFDEEVLENFVTRHDDTECLVDDTALMVDNQNEESTNDNEFFSPSDFIPTTNTGEIPTEVEEKVRYGFKFSGCNILNNVGSLLTRSHYDIKSSRYVNHHIQKLCSVTAATSIPLLYAEGMLFPSIFWKSARDKCSIIGAIPSSLLNANIKREGFASIEEHIRTRITSSICATSTDPRYISHCYDVTANMAASQSDTRLIIERGLTVPDSKKDNLGVRGQNDSELLGSVDSKQMVKNLCTSQTKIKWSYFLTFTANHSRHFGLKKIREWINKKGWSETFPDYDILELEEKKRN